MEQSKIIQSLCDLMTEDCRVDDEPYKKEWDELSKWSKILFKYMNGDKKFHSIFYQYDMAESLYEGAKCDFYYREGFLCGARLALEICGYVKEKG
ncbi:MAG: hypothetical protein K2I46_00280 [Clostridia bacterium]|nr:hypothetical protein [Clostridia bacterium]